jgi:predicted  nucleic acid-binding Zn-ribbon protein
MLKKIVIGTGAAALLGSMVFGRDVVSYTRTAWSATRDAVKREVPVEFQIERARTAVVQLTPAIQHTLKVIAEQQVDIEQMNKQIAQRTDDLQTAKEQMLTLKHDLESGKSTFRYASVEYTADDVKRDVRTRFERFKAAQAMLDRDRRIQKSRSQALFAHEKQLDQMLSQKKDLEAQVEQLEARMQTIRAEQSVSAPEIDESALSDVKRLIAEVNKQLDVQEKLLDASGKFGSGLIPVDTKPSVEMGNVTAEIDDYFKPAQDKKPTAVVKAVPEVVTAERSK